MIWPLRQGLILTTKKTNENGNFAPPSGIQMIFSVDLDIKFLMRKSATPSGMAPPLTEWQNPLWRRSPYSVGGAEIPCRY